ncbi:MAG: molecular chaperone TorD family protein [Candidatus Sericytochromatia bacterium]
MENLLKTEQEIKAEDVFEEEYLAFKLASLLSSYPEKDFLKNLAEFLENLKLISFLDEIFDNTWKNLHEKLINLVDNQVLLDEVRSDYIDLFDRVGTANSLYETEYGKERTILKTNELADISAFYKAFGLNLGDNSIKNEMPDHVSVEFEFYAFLLLKQDFLNTKKDDEGIDIVFSARKKFMEAHLGRFVISICESEGVANNTYFSTLYKFLSELIEYECSNLEIKPEKAFWLSSQAETDNFKCAELGCNLAGKAN